MIGAPFNRTSLLSGGKEMTLRRRRAECLLMVCNKAAKPAAMQYLFLPKPACPLIHDQSDQRRLQKVIICWSSSHSGSSAAQKRW